MAAAVWWVRRDLRLDDNAALQAALAHSGPHGRLIPLFILDPALLASDWVGAPRLAFLYGGLRALDADLRARGSRLLVRRGRPTAVLADLCVQTGATAVFAEEDYTPYARRRDAAVAAAVPLHLQPGLTVHHPTAVQKQGGGPYTVFTPFKRAWLALPLPRSAQLPPAPETLPPLDDPAAPVWSDPLPAEPALPETVPFEPGEAEGLRRLRRFVGGPIWRYAEQRDFPARQGTATLSPYLRFGMVSARRVVATAVAASAAAANQEQREAAQTWLSELIWREFYQGVLYHFPHVRRGSFRPEYDRIAWRNAAAEFAAWREGRTGYPIVDAAMRQLWQTGWMHNRARMIVASFLTKHLLIDWRWGERWFMQRLIDGDPAANNGGWQWSAGTGTDAAPYFRIFNPIAQGEKFDPDGVYVRRWVPELTAVPNQYIQQPWQMPPAVQQRVGCLIGRDYPAPIVDHAQARARTLAAYQAARRPDADP